MADLVELGGGRRATYEVVGDGEPLLVFPGGPGFAASFLRPDAELLADRFACHLIDPHGSGGSTPPADPEGYTNEGHARFYEDVRLALGLDRVCVYGLSFGGTVSLTYAALFPKVVHRCIAAAAFGLGSEVSAAEDGGTAEEMERMLQRHSSAAWYPEARRTWDEWNERVLAAEDPSEVDRMMATVLRLYAAEPDRPDVRKRIDELRPLLRSDLAAVKAWEGGMYQRIDLRPLLGRIQAPTLVMAGRLDPISGPAQARPIAAAVSNSELVVVPGCGHFLAIEEPEAFRSAVVDWTDRS